MCSEAQFSPMQSTAHGVVTDHLIICQQVAAVCLRPTAVFGIYSGGFREVKIHSEPLVFFQI